MGSLTRADLETLVQRMETALKGEVQNLKREVSELDTRVTVVEQEQSAVSVSIGANLTIF